MARKTRTTTATVTPPEPPPSRTDSFRPATYWGGLNPIVATIKGEMRRRRVLDLLAADRPEAIDEVLLGSALASDVSRFLRAIEPTLLTGESLPDFKPGEVEIARIVLRATRPMVVSLRAHRDRECIRIRLANDVAVALALPSTLVVMTRPHSQAGMMNLIDSVCVEPLRTGVSCVIHEELRPRLMEGMSPTSVAELVDVDSIYYPGLREAYAARIRAWCEFWAPKPAALSHIP